MNTSQAVAIIAIVTGVLAIHFSTTVTLLVVLVAIYSFFFEVTLC